MDYLPLCGLFLLSLAGIGLTAREVYLKNYPTIEYLKEKRETRLANIKAQEKWLKDINDQFERSERKVKQKEQWEDACISAGKILPYPQDM